MSKEHIVERTGDVDLKFAGRVLADVSSYEPSGDMSNRWQEITVYQTDGGRFVVQVVSRTCWQGEHDTHEATPCDTMMDVVEALRDEDGELSRLAKECMDVLLEKVPEFSSAAFKVIE